MAQSYLVKLITITAASFLVLVPLTSHSESAAAAQQAQVSVQEPRKMTVDDEIAVARQEIDLDHETLLNLREIDAEVYCLAQNTFFEARGESFKGKVAVTEVVKNRSESELFPDQVCDVIKQRGSYQGRTVCQFSWYCTGARRIPLMDSRGNIRPTILSEWRDSVEAAIIVSENMITHQVARGATHFYATRAGRPGWARSRNIQETRKIGNHTFLKVVSN